MNELDRHLTDHDLLLALDRELPRRGMAAAESHLGGCLPCRMRQRQITRAADAFNEIYLGDSEGEPDAAGTRARLRRTLRQAKEVPRWPRLLGSVASPGGAAAGLLIVAAVLAFQLGVLKRPSVPVIEQDALPVASLTPGATWDVTTEELCAVGAREQRPVPAEVRLSVVHGYGMDRLPESDYELDYLITPELGGAPDARNLWPQRYGSRTWNALVKDQLERLLPRLVCGHQLELRTAQREIASDWVAAYRKYFRTDLPLQARTEPIYDDDLMYPVWRTADRPLQLIAFNSVADR